MVIDERTELGRDLVADLTHVVEPVQLAAEALQHLQVRDRAHVARRLRRVRPLRGVLFVDDDRVLALRLRGHHRGLGAGTELARVHRVLRAERDADRHGDDADRGKLALVQPFHEPLRGADGVRRVAGAHDHAELLAAEPADDVLRPNGGAQRVGEMAEQLVADAVSVDVVDALEVVDVEHQHRDRRVRPARLLECVQQLLVEGAVIEEPGERVGARLMLEPLADLCVVECERGGVGEPAREVELVGAERPLLADAVDVEDALDLRARDQRDRDQRLRVDRRAGVEADARIEVRLVDECRLAVARRPAGDALVEADGRAHDLVGVLIADEHRRQEPLRLVRLVDRQRVVRNQLRQRVGDADEQRVEAQLCEHLVEHVGEPPIRLDELGRRGCSGLFLRQQPEDGRRPRYHAVLSDAGV